MNSINAEQPEQNHQDLRGDEALAKLRELVKSAQTCFFCTAIQSGHYVPTRPMSVQDVDDRGHLWFLCANDSHLYKQLTADHKVQLMFQGSPHTDFMTIYGTAKVGADKARIEQLWNPILKTWFTEGKSDPRIATIEVAPGPSYYWDTKHGRVVVLAKMIAGAITGKTLDDSMEGKLKV